MAKANTQIKDGVKYEIIGIIFLALAVLCVAGLFTKTTGLVGDKAIAMVTAITGDGRFLLPLVLAFYGVKLIIERKKSELSARSFGILALFLIIMIFMHLWSIDFSKSPGYKAVFQAGYDGKGGGLIGALFSFIGYKLFGTLGLNIILVAATIVTLVLITDISVNTIFKQSWEKFKILSNKIKADLVEFLFTENEEEPKKPAKKIKSKEKTHPIIFDADQFNNEQPVTGTTEAEKSSPQINFYNESEEKKQVDTPVTEDDIDLTNMEINDQGQLALRHDEFQLPPITLLSRTLKLKNTRMNKDITENIHTLEDTLESFGIKAKITQVSRGPAITRYEIAPAPGVKVSRIVSLADDIALNLAASDVRIEAPIPGKAAVGIEVPNKEVSMVHMRELLESQEFVNSKSKLTVGFGKDIAGNPILADLAKMPHLLIAGATGSGKSVCMNTLITSILFKARPDEVKFLMIDPKMVELTNYNGIPHLMSPVVTDSKKAATALRWIVREMEKRYEMFAGAGVKDIERYNNLLAKDGDANILPQVVVVIDELADLMMVAPADVEDAICRLAQMARAAGIHLVVATQRPSVDVITGLIKANIPSRISFAVSSQIDSRTILDMAGAEKLLGKGDMLFFPTGASKPLRVQGAFLSDKEVDDLVNFLKKQGQPDYKEIPYTVETKTNHEAPEDDELLPQAVKIFIESGQASISMLQRRLRIGYTRAARLIDIMEERNIVGPYEGSKPRTILMSLDQYHNTFGEM